MKTTTMRNLVSQAISLAGLFGAIAALWQIVRFLQGSVGVAEPFAMLEAYLSTAFGPSVFGHYVSGIVSWTIVALIAAGTGYALSRIIDVGWHQFLTEEKVAHDARVRFEKIEDARERRRAARSRLSSDEKQRLQHLERRVADLEANRR